MEDADKRIGVIKELIAAGSNDNRIALLGFDTEKIDDLMFLLGLSHNEMHQFLRGAIYDANLHLRMLNEYDFGRYRSRYKSGNLYSDADVATCTAKILLTGSVILADFAPKYPLISRMKFDHINEGNLLRVIVEAYEHNRTKGSRAAIRGKGWEDALSKTMDELGVTHQTEQRLIEGDSSGTLDLNVLRRAVEIGICTSDGSVMSRKVSDLAGHMPAYKAAGIEVVVLLDGTGWASRVSDLKRLENAGIVRYTLDTVDELIIWLAAGAGVKVTKAQAKKAWEIGKEAANVS